MLASLCASAQSDTLLMRVGHLPVSRGEFLYAYRKNAGALPPSDFLRRFVRLKWRVCHAQTEGLDTTRLFRQQFENCKLRLQKLNRQQQASVSPEAPDTDGRWIAHVCLRIPQSVSYSGTRAWVAKLDSVSAAMPSAGELASWIEQNAGHLPAGWQAEIICVKPYQLPNELLTRLRLLKPDETSRPFLSAAGVHLIGRLTEEEIPEEEAAPRVRETDKQYLLREYHDGLLAGMVEDELLQTDDERLKHYYKKHKKHYRWKLPHFKGIILQANDKERLERLLTYLDGFPEEEWTDAIRRFDEVGGSQWLKVEEGLFQIGTNASVDKLFFGQGEFTPSPDYPYVQVLGKVLKRKPESYKDVYALLERDYKAGMLAKEEEKWAKKFKVEINQEVLKTVKSHDAI